MLKAFFLVAIIAGCVCASAVIASPGNDQAHLWPPTGTRMHLAVTRDTWLSSVGNERIGSNGGAGKLKVKGLQEYAIIDIDPAPLKGKIITGALLHLRSASPDKAPLARIGVSTIASKWVEGSSRWYLPQPGASCFDQAAFLIKDWAYKGSSLVDVVFGRGNTIWKFADCTPPDRDGWQTVAVAPKVVAARVAGISHGFCIYDEVGSTWSITHGVFKYNQFPNRFFYSRQSGRSGPWLEVWTNGTDSIPPAPISSIRTVTKGLPGGEAILEWKTPPDSGGGKTLGFQGEITADGKTRSIPGYLIPMARKAGQTVRMHLQDLSLKPGEKVLVTLRPVDSAGNIGAPFSQAIQVSSGVSVPAIRITGIPVFKAPSKLPKINGVTVSVLDLLDKVNPLTGDIIPREDEHWKHGDYLFSAKDKTIRLYSARNETVCFQLNLKGSARSISIHCRFENAPSIKPGIYQFGYVNVGEGAGKRLYPLPDPLVPVDGSISIPSSAGKVRVEGQKNHSVVCEIYVPHEEPAGKKFGKVRIDIGNEHLELGIELTIWNFTLPDKLSFVPEMNAYGTVSPYIGYDYYRLAHENRTCLNRLPYGWNGVPSFAPKWNGKNFDWTKWDKYVGPLLDGSAFKDLPRKNEPVDVMYLPFNENWPISVYKGYRPSYWADEAFTKAYRNDLKKAFRAFAAHCAKMGWNNTIFEFYLNGKIYYRKRDPESSAPWIFDEPVDTQDFWALRWFGMLWQEAVQPYKTRIKAWFRADVSYSQFERNILRGITDIEYLGGNTAQKTRMKHDDQVLFGKSYFGEYGSPNAIDAPNTQPVLWCLSAWANGAVGVLPWQTIGDKEAWEKGETTALFYPTPDGPLPSVRLKAFMMGEQLIEYLTLYSRLYHLPRYAVAKWLRNFLTPREGEAKQSGSDSDAFQFNNVSLYDLWRLRYTLGELISQKAPACKRSLLDIKSPKFDPARLPDIGYVTPAPLVTALKPKCDSFRPG